MSFTANGKRILVLAISEPARGAWVADVEVESDTDLEKTVTLDLGSPQATFVGTVVLGAVYRGRWVARIVGGAGKLSIPVESRYYDNETAKTVLGGLMADSGEKQDGAIAPSLLSTALAKWLRPAGEPQLALDDLANELDATWRVLRAGTVWLGSEKWPELSMPHVELSPGPSAGTLSVAPTEAPLVRPGVSFLAHRISYVVTTIQGGKLRQKLWIEKQGQTHGDRLLDVLSRLVNRLLGRRLTYLGTYPSTVVGQTGDYLALEIVPDDAEVKGEGLKRVPIRHGSPGWGVRVPNGTRVSLKFDAGDPLRPFVSEWEPGAVTEVTFAGGTRGAMRLGDMVSCPLSPQNIVDLALKLVCAAPGSPPLASPDVIAAAAIPGAPLVPANVIRGVGSSGSQKFKPGG